MTDFQARHMIEALRSGVPSRAVGAYFCSARQDFIEKVDERLSALQPGGRSDSFVFFGRYGEEKTHMLNTIFEMASRRNMAVTYLPLSMENPFGNLKVPYPKVMANTYLPGSVQSGVFGGMEGFFTPNSGNSKDALLFTRAELETDRPYHVFRNWLEAEEAEDHYLMQADLEGDLARANDIKSIQKRIFSQTLKFETKFSYCKNS